LQNVKAKKGDNDNAPHHLLVTYLPLKKMPSTQANATRRSAKLSDLQAIASKFYKQTIYFVCNINFM